MTESVENVTTMIVEASVVGEAVYPSKMGAFTNDEVGEYKNSWMVGIGTPDTSTRGGDISGGEAINEAKDSMALYDFEEDIYITNNTVQAEMIEDGWNSEKSPMRADLGWKDKSGYGIVSGNVGRAKSIILETFEKVKNSKALDSDDAPF